MKDRKLVDPLVINAPPAKAYFSSSVRGAAVPRSIRHRRPPANFAAGCNCKNNRRRVIHLHYMLGADVAGGENGNERRRGRALFYAWPSLCIFALDEAHGTYNLKSEFTRCFDRLYRGGTGRADIIDNRDTGALPAKAFNTLPSAVLLFGLTHEESIQLATHHRDGRHDRIGAHGEAADRLRLPSLLSYLAGKYFAGQARALSVKSRGAAVDVIVAGAARRKLELAQPERLGSEQAQQILAGRMHEILR